MSNSGRLYERALELAMQQVDVESAIGWLIEAAQGSLDDLDGALKWATGALHHDRRDRTATRAYLLLQEACERHRTNTMRPATRLAALWAPARNPDYAASLYDELNGIRPE